MCTFLLKMREYYRWEKNLKFGSSLSQDDIGEWLATREQYWSKIANQPFQSLPLSEDTDPFDATSINNNLIPQGYVYSSGYGVFGKPHFFLGKLSETRKLDKLTVYISTKEFARDLVTPPAMSIDHNIFIRQESVRRFIWEKIEEWRSNKNKSGPMKNVLAQWNDWDDMKNLEPILDTLVETETETMILHEIGEIQAGEALGNHWKHMVNDMSGTKAEFFLRAVRDILADCMVTLPALLEEEKSMPIHSYFANYSGLRKHLFPELKRAYEQWVDHNNTDIMSALIYKGIDRWQHIATQALENYKANGINARSDIEAQMHSLLPVA